MAQLRQGQLLIGSLDPYNSKDQVQAYATAGAVAFAMELLPRTTRAQAMDVLSSQANLAGYKAVVDAMAEYGRVMPMMMTAAGTVTPAKVFIVGAGVAGLQAIATARRMGAVVTATDVRPAAREETESLGAKFVGFVPADAATSGGYARPLTPEEQAEQAKMVAEHLKGQDIVVTTAQIPGRTAPRIVTAEMVKSMKSGSVVLDMAAESGGNVEGSKPGKTVAVGRRQADRRPQPRLADRTGHDRALRQEPVQLHPAPGRPEEQGAEDRHRRRPRQGHAADQRRPGRPRRLQARGLREQQRWKRSTPASSI